MGEALDAVVIATGTGGTITGIARVLKKHKPAIQMVCVDPVGSIYYDYWRTGKVPDLFKTYKVEGFGEDFLPTTTDFTCVDEVVQVTDKECFLTARELTRKEGLFTGGSGGGAVAGALTWASPSGGAHDSGAAPRFGVALSQQGVRRPVAQGEFLPRRRVTAGQGVRSAARKRQPLIKQAQADGVADIIALMKKHGVSQIPVLDGESLVGMINEVRLLRHARRPRQHRPAGQGARRAELRCRLPMPMSRLSQISLTATWRSCWKARAPSPSSPRST